MDGISRKASGLDEDSGLNPPARFRRVESANLSPSAAVVKENQFMFKRYIVVDILEACVILLPGGKIPPRVGGTQQFGSLSVDAGRVY